MIGEERAHLGRSCDLGQKCVLRRAFRDRNQNKCLVLSRWGSDDDRSQEQFLRLNKGSQGIQGQWEVCGGWLLSLKGQTLLMLRKGLSQGCDGLPSLIFLIKPLARGRTMDLWSKSFTSAKFACYWNANIQVQQWVVITGWEVTLGKVEMDPYWHCGSSRAPALVSRSLFLLWRARHSWVRIFRKIYAPTATFPSRKRGYWDALLFSSSFKLLKTLPLLQRPSRLYLWLLLEQFTFLKLCWDLLLCT